eukprot:COSAG05_NODE_13520_length_427_cov_0.585366_1_plen_87_part_10
MATAVPGALLIPPTRPAAPRRCAQARGVRGEFLTSDVCSEVLRHQGRARGGRSISASLRATLRGFFKQKTAYEILRSDWSSDVCSSD